VGGWKGPNVDRWECVGVVGGRKGANVDRWECVGVVGWDLLCMACWGCLDLSG